MTPPIQFTAKRLRAETAAMRRLAGALVGDSAVADDVVQQTWLAAVRRPPSTERPVRPWLARVLRRNAVTWGRAAARLRDRENAAAGPSTADAGLEQLQVARELIDELRQLSREDQELLYLVFWEDLSSADCAKQLGRPASTVRSHLQRALGRLRTRLDARGGGREGWVAGLLPMIGGPARQGGVGLAAVAAAGLGAIGLCVVAVTPQGCGVSSGTAAEDVASPRDRNARDSSTPTAPRRAQPPRRRSRSAATSEPAPEEPTTDVRSLKMAFRVGLNGVSGALRECVDATGTASVRSTTKIAFDREDSPSITEVYFDDPSALSEDELECLRQTLLSIEVPQEFRAEKPVEVRQTYDLLFQGDAPVRFGGVRRGPAMHLLSVRKDGTDLDEAVEACGPAGATAVRITFDPLTGAPMEIESEDPRVSDCIETALRKTIIGGLAFEPALPEDAVLLCTFTGDAHDCKRLGPKGTYIPVED